MQITDPHSTASSSVLSILKSANEQPRLAGELISRTVENMVQIQAAQSPAQPLAISEITGIGKIINTTA